jgi:carbon-monoxide dehydrogenase small subunit
MPHHGTTCVGDRSPRRLQQLLEATGFVRAAPSHLPKIMATSIRCFAKIPIEMQRAARPTWNNNNSKDPISTGEDVFMSAVKLTVNGKAVAGDVEDRTLLVQFLRDHLGLTGTHVGCDTSQCGACVVHIDGRAVKSCTVLVGQAAGANVTTIEGIAKGDELHPMQAAFRDNHGLQCGFCTPGMIMSSIDIVNRHGGSLDEATVRQELEGNICRCTGYHNIVKSVLDAAGRMKVSQAAE